MPQEIKTICQPLPYHLGSVNCYLLSSDAGFLLIDTGCSNQRLRLDNELENAGCTPGKLNLVLITHGDFDHIGNAAHLRMKYGVRIAMHAGDYGMAERGDMFWNREKGNFLFRIVAPILIGFTRSDRFTPDCSLEDGADLSEYGFDARVFSIPGHSMGSIAVRTAGSALFCGDLFENIRKPALSSIMDSVTTARLSVAKLGGFEINTVYPGHGAPFSWDALPNRTAQ